MLLSMWRKYLLTGSSSICCHDGAGGEGGGGGGNNEPPPKKKDEPQLPPSKHDAPLPEKQDTFERAYVEELRSENRTWRGKVVTERTARETADRERDEAKAAATKAKDDADKAANEKVTAANTAADQRIIRSEMKAEALKAGMIDLDGLKLADLATVKLNDKGEVEGADKVIEQLKKDKPYLFGTKSGTTNTDNKPPKPEDGKPVDVRKLTPEEYKAKKAEVTGKR